MNLKRKPYRPIPADPSIKCSYCLMEKNMELPVGKAQICEGHIIAFRDNRQKFRAESMKRAEGDMIDLDNDEQIKGEEWEAQELKDGKKN